MSRSDVRAFSYFAPSVFGVGLPSLRVERVSPDPDKAEYCTATIAVSGGNECRVNRFTHEVLNRRDGELWYVCHSSDDPDIDARNWAEWLVGMGMA